MESMQIFAMVFNIPFSYRAAQLRNFFSELLECNGFNIFHYRHRPMCKRIYDDFNDIESKHPSKESACCCIISCKVESYHRLRSSYHLHHWKDDKNRSHPTQCFIYPIFCVTGNDDCTKHNLDREFTVKPCDDKKAGNLYMAFDDIMEFKEMQPPDVMPQGNVGTSSKIFLEYINSCRLPPLVIRKLNLKFKKEGGKYYTSVPYDYSGKQVSQSQPSAVPASAEPARTALRHKILNHTEYVEERQLQQKMQREEERNKPHRKLLTESDTASSSHTAAFPDQLKRTTCLHPFPVCFDSAHSSLVESDGETEEWDRHEAFHDDPANYERNKERLYEEKIELKWEKGGSGLVFYTDAQYWKKLEGDFDEQTTDDWDVDMSEYYEPGTGDKDAQDYIKMRAEDRLRGDIAHLEEVSAFDKPIGSFEQHTKGVGRSVLESQGWKDGQGMGRKEEGRAHIIDTDGQHPRDKRGLGFYGEKVARFVTPRGRKRVSDEAIISTKYDDPADTDESDNLLERKNPHNIKHRGLPKR
ncbi:G patch domain-containing protein 3-like [Watersipora subatra]|uniref:G patch domain-containing protein 3-like n=1 Tax=Watersipora subatra TaxID=2589382 RepID=UPI00355BC60D